MSTLPTHAEVLDRLSPEERRVVERFIAAEPRRRRQPPKKVGVKAKVPKGIPQSPRRYKDREAAVEAVKGGREAADRAYEKRQSAKAMQRRVDRGLPPT